MNEIIYNIVTAFLIFLSVIMFKYLFKYLSKYLIAINLSNVTSTKWSREEIHEQDPQRNGEKDFNSLAVSVTK